jgi:hypothetical protein
MWDDVARRKIVSRAGPGTLRLHAPYNEQFNSAVRENRSLFIATEKEVDGPAYQLGVPKYFWRYFRSQDIRLVVNIVASTFGDSPGLTRSQTTSAERMAARRHDKESVRILDTETGTARFFDRKTAQTLIDETLIVDKKGKTKPGRYQMIK